MINNKNKNLYKKILRNKETRCFLIKELEELKNYDKKIKPVLDKILELEKWQ